MKELEYK